MKDLIKLFLTDFRDFVRSNWKVLIVCLTTIIIFQFFGKGNIVINLSIIIVHISGDVMMIIALTKYAQNKNKSGAIYMTSSTIFFVIIGLTAVLQSNENKNWQYFLGTVPFLVANTYQIMDAWNLKGKKIFNYKLTGLIAMFIAYLYYQMNLIYNYAWIQVLGFSLFPVFLGMTDTLKVYLGRIMSVILLLIGAIIDIIIQFSKPGIVPATTLSAFFITLIAFFGFLGNAKMYIRNDNNSWDNKLLRILAKF